MKAGFRGLPLRYAQAGFSILASIILLAVAGSVAVTLDSISLSTQSLLAASLTAAPETNLTSAYTGSGGLNDPKEKTTVSDTSTGGGTALCVGRTGTVTTTPIQYACFQKGDVNRVKQFIQSTPLGFEISITIDNKGILEVRPSPLATLSSYCAPQNPPSCTTGPAVVSASTEKSRVKADEPAKSAILDTLPNMSATESKELIRNEFSGFIPKAQQDALFASFDEAITKEDFLKNTAVERADIARQLLAVDCPDPFCPERQALDARDTQLVALQGSLQRQLDVLKDNQVRLIAQEISDPVPFSSSVDDPGLRFPHGESTFETSSFDDVQDPQEETTNWWESAKKGVQSWWSSQKDMSGDAGLAPPVHSIQSEQGVLAVIATERDRAQAVLDKANSDVAVAQKLLNDAGRIDVDPTSYILNLEARQTEVDIATARLNGVQTDYDACAAGNCPAHIVDDQTRAAKGEGVISNFLRNTNDAFAADRAEREARLSQAIDPFKNPSGYLWKSLVQNPIDGVGWVADGVVETLAGGTRAIAQKVLPTPAADFLEIRGTPEEVLGCSTNPGRCTDEAANAGIHIGLLVAPFTSPVRIGKAIVTRVTAGKPPIQPATNPIVVANDNILGVGKPPVLREAIDTDFERVATLNNARPQIVPQFPPSSLPFSFPARPSVIATNENVLGSVKPPQLPPSGFRPTIVAGTDFERAVVTNTPSKTSVPAGTLPGSSFTIPSPITPAQSPITQVIQRTQEVPKPLVTSPATPPISTIAARPLSPIGSFPAAPFESLVTTRPEVVGSFPAAPNTQLELPLEGGGSPPSGEGGGDPPSGGNRIWTGVKFCLRHWILCPTLLVGGIMGLNDWPGSSEDPPPPPSQPPAPPSGPPPQIQGQQPPAQQQPPGQQPPAPPPTYTQEELERIVQERNSAWQRAMDASRNQQQEVPQPQQPQSQNPFTALGQSIGELLNRFFSNQRSQRMQESPDKKPEDMSAPTSLTPHVIIVANPNTIDPGLTSRLSWASVFTTSCTITDIHGAKLVESGESSGTVVTSNLSTTMGFSVLCNATRATSTVSATTTVIVR